MIVRSPVWSVCSATWRIFKSHRSTLAVSEKYSRVIYRYLQEFKIYYTKAIPKIINPNTKMRKTHSHKHILPKHRKEMFRKPKQICKLVKRLRSSNSLYESKEWTSWSYCYYMYSSFFRNVNGYFVRCFNRSRYLTRKLKLHLDAVLEMYPYLASF